MLDVKFIRDHPEKVRENLKKRVDFDIDIVDRFLELDQQWREEKQELDSLRAQRNSESKKIGEIKKQGGDIEEQREKVKEIANQLEEKENTVSEVETKRADLLQQIPNMLDEDVPEGESDEENVPVKTVGGVPEFSFEPKNHQDLCEMNEWYDLERAARNAGARFYYLKNELVLLETTLYNYVLSKLVKKGYVPMEVPPMLKREVAEKAIPLGEFEDTIYKILSDDEEELFLIGTSEHSLATYHMNEKLNHKELPLKYAGLSPCFRREAGVTKDSKGIFRVHNFNKIEQFVYCREEDSEYFLKEILENAEEIFQELEIPYRIVDICSGDIGNFAAKKYDLEAWLPGQEKYREMVSASNYRDYGARRVNCRYQDSDGELKTANTLNSTAVALQRTIIAIIENHQTPEGDVKLPKVLQDMMGKEYLKLN